MTFLASFLLVFGQCCLAGNGGSEGSGSTTELVAEPVPYCELATHPAKYDGVLILTEATWSRGIHSWLLNDMRCPQAGERSISTLPSFPNDSPDTAKRRELTKRIDGKRGSARVDVIGVFRYRQDTGFAGPDGQRFQIEVSKLLDVR
jgi:hypothetical protein